MINDERIQTYIWDIVDKIRRDYQPERIILFGSYAYGQPHADSDIDMLIIKDTNERSLDRLVRAQQIAFDWQRDVPFEPIVYTPQETQQGLAAGDPLLCEIFEKGEILMSTSESLNPPDWFRKGDDDLHVAALLLREHEPLGIAAMLIQQGVEKYLKGYLLSTGWGLRRIHSLEELIRAATPHDVRFASFLAACQKMNAYYIEGRYPLLATTSLTDEEVSQSLVEAKALVALIQEKLKTP